MLTGSQVQAIKEADALFSVAHDALKEAINTLLINGVYVPPRSDFRVVADLRRDLAELLRRDVLQRAGAVPD